MTGVRWGVDIFVFCDVNTLVDPVRRTQAWDPSLWPAPPPVQSKYPAAVQLLKMMSESRPGDGLHLVTSDHVLRNVRRALVGDYEWPGGQADQWLRWLHGVSKSSGGEYVTSAPRAVHDCSDHEDNLMLDGAFAARKVDIIVSGDAQHVLPLATNGVFRSSGLLHPEECLGRVDAAIRQARRR